MISALIGGFTGIAKKPSSILISFIGTVLSAAVFLLCLDSYENVFFSALLFGEVPDATLWDLPFHFLNSYAPDLAIIGLSMLAAIAISVLTLFAYSKIAGDKKAGTVEALKFAASKAGDALLLSIFFMVALFLFSTVAFVLFAAAISFETLGIIAAILFVAWLAFGAYVFIKLVFTPLSISINGLPLKKAIAESWKLSSGKFIPLVVFLFAAWFVSGIVSGAGVAASDIASLAGQDELSIILLLIGICISGAYYNIALSKYFWK